MGIEVIVSMPMMGMIGTTCRSTMDAPTCLLGFRLLVLVRGRGFPCTTDGIRTLLDVGAALNHLLQRFGVAKKKLTLDIEAVEFTTLEWVNWFGHYARFFKWLPGACGNAKPLRSFSLEFQYSTYFS